MLVYPLFMSVYYLHCVHWWWIDGQRRQDSAHCALTGIIRQHITLPVSSARHTSKYIIPVTTNDYILTLDISVSHPCDELSPSWMITGNFLGSCPGKFHFFDLLFDVARHVFNFNNLPWLLCRSEEPNSWHCLLAVVLQSIGSYNVWQLLHVRCKTTLY